MYNVRQVCEMLGVSTYTITNWYSWQKKQIDQGIVSEPYLPEPIKLEDVKGKPRRWDDEMVEKLKEYKHNIVIGRNGIYGKYTNPNHKNTRKYKKLTGVQDVTN